MRSKFIFLFILSNITFGQKMDSDILYGIRNSNLVGDSIQLEKRTYKAYKKMRKAALNDGV